MNNRGVIFKRCCCQDPASGRPLGRTCPQLSGRGHGSWYFHVSVTNLMGGRERMRRGADSTARRHHHTTNQQRHAQPSTRRPDMHPRPGELIPVLAPADR